MTSGERAESVDLLCCARRRISREPNEALAETTGFLPYGKDAPDRRQAGKAVYPRDERLLRRLRAVLAGAETAAGIAKKIIDKKAGCLLALERHQETLHAGVKSFAAGRKTKDCKDTAVGRPAPIGGDQGRIETRRDTAIHDAAWRKERHDWPGLNGAVMAESTREIGGKIEPETRFCMTSLTSLASLTPLAARARTAGPMIRGQGAGETGPHGVMDPVFRDGECRSRAEPAPANLTALNRMPPTLPRRAPGKDSLRLRRKTAAGGGGSRASRRAA